jgi:uncharacterized membrane protein HdeD (DUF308 family)
MADPLPPALALNKSRGWLVFLGILSVLVGVFAIAYPLVATLAIEQVIGALLIVTGVFSLGAVLFGRERHHRFTTVVLGFIRVIAGLALFIYIAPGMVAITAILGAFFLAEGVVFIVSALGLRHNRAWPLVLLNGLIALVLGGFIFANLASNTWVVGLLYGINSIFYGISLLGLAAAAHGRE